jgi:nitrogen regulatory protein PII
MKQVIAIVKPFNAERVLKNLRDLPIEECTVREVKGFGRQKNYLDLYRNNEFSLIFVAKVEIAFVVGDEWVDTAIERINAASRTGRLGDGKILVLPLWGECLSLETPTPWQPPPPAAP